MEAQYRFFDHMANRYRLLYKTYVNSFGDWCFVCQNDEGGKSIWQFTPSYLDPEKKSKELFEIPEINELAKFEKYERHGRPIWQILFNKNICVIRDNAPFNYDTSLTRDGHLQIEHSDKVEIPNNDLLAVENAAEYCNTSIKTIRNWCDTMNGDKPMLPGVVGTGRFRRIPRSSLDPYRKPVQQNK